MEAELRKAPASYRMSMLSRVRNYKHDVEQLTADVVCYLRYIASIYDCLSLEYISLYYVNVSTL